MIYKSLKQIERFPSKYKLLLVSFYITHKKTLKKLQTQWKKQQSNNKKFLGRTKNQTKQFSLRSFGGCISILDPNNLSKGIIDEIACPAPTGLYYDKKDFCLYVACKTHIKKIRGGQIIGRIDNSLFNDLNWLINSLDKKIFISSSGTDTLLEIDPKTEKVLWDWIATEENYSKTPLGSTRIIERDKNYQKVVIPTIEQTTHVNSCLHYKKRKLLATLFHQGKLIKIDMLTKKSKCLIRGLSCPHSIRKRIGGGYTLSDTKNNRIILLNDKLGEEKIIKNNFDWVQDVIETKKGEFVVGDSNNDRILKINSQGEIISTFNLPKNSRKMFMFLFLTKEDILKIFYDRKIL